MDKLRIEDFNTDIEEKFDYEKIYNDCFVDLDVVIERPPMALSIGTYEYKGINEDLAVHTYGEFSATVAPSKTKKSFYKSALIASYIGGKSQNLFPNIKTHRDKDWYIVDIDTEQGKFYAQNVFRRVERMVGKRYDNYLPFSMRSKSPEERVNFVDALLEDERYKGKIKFISIDGIADLVENTNDILMSANIGRKVLKWTDEHNVHLHTVIHKLMNLEKPTGHLGSYVLKQAESVMFLSKEDEDDKHSNIIVNQKYSRGIAFDDFSFNINPEGLPYLVEKWEGGKTEKQIFS